MKAETGSPSSSTRSSALRTPDSTAGEQSTSSESSNSNSDETQQAESISIQSNASASNKGKQKPKDDVGETRKAENLVGKINNLVTTDLGNITDARDFMFICESEPLTFMIFMY